MTRSLDRDRIACRYPMASALSRSSHDLGTSRDTDLLKTHDIDRHQRRDPTRTHNTDMQGLQHDLFGIAGAHVALCRGRGWREKIPGSWPYDVIMRPRELERLESALVIPPGSGRVGTRNVWCQEPKHALRSAGRRSVSSLMKGGIPGTREYNQC